jgi:methylglutaconyl-CoA hydratase
VFETRSTCRAELDERGAVTLTLARPEKHNALGQQMVSELDDLLGWAAGRPETRLLVLAAEGKHFCAGADLADMQAMAAASYQENIADARRIAAMLRRLDTFPRPTLALVQGAAYGGAVGLACCCDMVIASPQARFCLSEVRLGLAAAVISPYVLRALGSRQARRFVLTAEVVEAAEAVRAGFAHQIAEDLAAARAVWEHQVLAGAPGAQAAAKALLAAAAGRPIDDDLVAMTAARIAELRAAPEGREGLAAFFDRRPPAWARQGE